VVVTVVEMREVVGLGVAVVTVCVLPSGRVVIAVTLIMVSDT
jgi:hypothetical protein